MPVRANSASGPYYVADLARDPDVSAPEAWIRRWSDAGEIPCQRDRFNRRVFGAEAFDIARRLRARQLQRVGVAS